MQSVGEAITVNTKKKEVSRYLETITPSLYKRDEFDKMFE